MEDYNLTQNEERPSMTDYKPSNMLVWSILSTVLCCVPTGIVAIIYSARVDKLWYSGDRDGARTASKRAKTFVIIGAVLGIIVGIVYAAFIMRMSPEQMSEMLEMYGM